jgi:hypothetical protein
VRKYDIHLAVILILVCGLLGYKFAQILDKEKETPESIKGVNGSQLELKQPSEFDFADGRFKKRDIFFNHYRIINKGMPVYRARNIYLA